MPHYWQHETPLNCPKGHMMYWLGGAFWICAKCRPKIRGSKQHAKGCIYVQTGERDA